MLRPYAFILIIFFAMIPACAETVPKEVYLLIGQSNMAGRGKVTKDISVPLTGAYLLNSKGQWESARNPLNRYSTIRKSLGMQKLGPGFGFTLEMMQQRPKVTIGLVVNAKGGSKIKEWQPGATFFSEAVMRTKQALAAGAELKGILWHQGESDSNNGNYVKKDLKPIIIALRKEFGNPDLPFIVGETFSGDFKGKKSNRDKINKQLKQVPALVPVTACASSKGLSTFDGTHFDTKSQLELGKRYATAMLGLQKSK
ncbi:MAG: sialate O-acetylesterase [Planctomycetes bacterium]|nr:sialate O-acetylesterase [Planctomycetota bacterium]